jgi:hypothetical protein
MILDSTTLYPNLEERHKFEARLKEFRVVDECSKTIQYEKGIITYLTESVIPSKADVRPPLLLLFGNPTPESVNNGCFFASEKKRREHRFWKAIGDAGIISFEPLPDNNKQRTQALFDLKYSSPYRVGLAVLYSMPSPASDPKWSGVQGLRRLFGSRALAEITKCEKQRILELIKGFIPIGSSGRVIAFQKDAGNEIKDQNKASAIIARNGRWVVSKAKCVGSEIDLYQMQPTRYMNAHWYADLLHAATRIGVEHD